MHPTRKEMAIAAGKGHVAIVELLIQCGADINQAGTDGGMTPVIAASYFARIFEWSRFSCLTVLAYTI
jgi:hypothetical protein